MRTHPYSHQDTPILSSIATLKTLLFLRSPNRKSPGEDTYATEQSEKEQEVIPTVTSMAVVADAQGGAISMTSLEGVDAKLNSPPSRGIEAPPTCVSG